MPADKKKSNSGKGSEKKSSQLVPPKLHASAKEFVPSTSLKASANTWKPTGKDSKPPASESGGAPKNGKDGAAAAKPSAADAVKQAPKAPVVSAWGSKSSDAVKKAAPVRQQQQQQNKPAQQRNQWQQQGGRGGGGGRNQGNRGPQKGGGGGGDNNRQWGRSNSKPGSDRGGGRDGGDRGAGQGQGRRQSQNRGGGGNNNGQGGGDPNDNSNWARGKAVPVELMDNGEGKTDAEKAVKRINVDDLLDMRLNFLDQPSSWGEEECATKPPPVVLWDAPTRVAEIEEASKAPRIGGDVSRSEKKRRDGKGGKPNPNDTAPPLEDCKPIEVNEETRWKAKVMVKDGGDAEKEEEESSEDVLRKAMVILNKLSLTKFDKLSDDFINCGIGRDVECLTGAVGLIVNYAQEQQHFSSMYAGLCLKLANTPMEAIDGGSKKGKKFKKILLTRCQTEFETDTSTKIAEATKDITNEEEIEYHANLFKKHYLGHMRFIGELYKGDLISIKIMLFCLPALLKGEDGEESTNEVDEEKVECFSKLMTVIGDSLEKQSEAMKNIGKADAAESLADCWRIVEIMAGKRKEKGPKVSNRIKFMLQDLLEMKSKGWVTRRKEETAKTIAQIHKEVAKEERAAARRSNSSASLGRMNKGSMRRGSSSGDVRNMDNKQQSKPQVDADGFTSVAPSSKGFGRSASMTAMQRNEGSQKYSTRGSTSMGSKRPSQGKFSVLNENVSRRSSKKGSSKSDEKAAAKAAKEAAAAEEEKKKPKVTYLTPDECGDKAKNVLKEYFVGGDTEDAVLSIHELVGVGDDGSIDRGTKVVEQAVLFVLEEKAANVEKFLTVYLRCAKEKKIEGQSFVSGLNDPLEFLNDVAIDAPLAIPHLATIIAELVKAEIVSFNFLLDSPEYFRTDQNAAGFGAKVMKIIGGDASTKEEYIEVIDKLMTCEDKAKHSSAADLIAEA